MKPNLAVVVISSLTIAIAGCSQGGGTGGAAGSAGSGGVAGAGGAGGDSGTGGDGGAAGMAGVGGSAGIGGAGAGGAAGVGGGAGIGGSAGEGGTAGVGGQGGRAGTAGVGGTAGTPANRCAFYTGILVTPLTQSLGNLIDVDTVVFDFDGDPVEVMVTSDCGAVADPLQTANPSSGASSTTARCDQVGVCSVTIRVSDDGFDPEGCDGTNPAASSTTAVDCTP